jgi:hypothetical protein
MLTSERDTAVTAVNAFGGARAPMAAIAATPTTLYFHGNLTDDAGCSGVGNADGVLCGGPFMLPKSSLGSLISAHWNVPGNLVDGTTDQNITDPNWIWNVSSPITIGGDMTVNWWASCGACGQDPFFSSDWIIRLWADGTKVYEQQVTNLTPLILPNIPEELTTTVTVPTITANSKLVLHIDPVFIDPQATTRIYYDSQSPCPGSQVNEPCDSHVVIPLQPGGAPSPTPTPTGSPTPAPSVQSGILSPSNPEINFVAGPFATSNPSSKTSGTPVCGLATPCSQFIMQIEIPAGDPNTYMANVILDWTDSGLTTQGNTASDFDLYAYRPDSPLGAKVAESTSTNNPEALSFTAVAGDYTIYAVPYDVSPSVQPRGTIRLVRVNGAPSPTPSPSPGAPNASAMGFSSLSFSALEGCAEAEITVMRTGVITGTSTVDYVVTDDTATQRGDYEFAAGELTFGPGEISKTFNVLINEDSYVEGTETAIIALTGVSGGIIGVPAQATLEIDDNETSQSNDNVIDQTSHFVCQHYHDFLNRQGDPGGLSFWANEIDSCGNDAACIFSRRVGVSAAFFIEAEFQDTGFYVYRLFKASLGRRPSYVEFMTDWGQLVVNSNLDAEKTEYSEKFVQRSEHASKYSSATDAASYVDALIETVLDNSGVNLTARRNDLLSHYNAGSNIVDSRARALRTLVEYPEFQDAENNRAFVLAQYFNYLRREPEESGYQFWLNVLNTSEPNNYRAMVCAFITSREYQERFGSVITYDNSACAGLAP